MTISYSPQVEKLLTPKQVVALAPDVFNENTLAYWRHMGTGPKCWAKIGRRVCYRESGIIAWIDAQFNDQVSA